MRKNKHKDELWMLDDSVSKLTSLIRSESIEVWKECVEGQDYERKLEQLRRMSIRLTDHICSTQEKLFGGPPIE